MIILRNKYSQTDFSHADEVLYLTQTSQKSQTFASCSALAPPGCIHSAQPTAASETMQPSLCKSVVSV